MADSQQLTPLLLDAKKEYVGQLTDVLAPYVLSYMSGLWAAAAAEHGREATREFRTQLREIPVWNSGIVQSKTQEVEGRFPYLGDLIAAVFVSVTKILSSIKLNNDTPNIRLRLPPNDQVVHSVYINTAKEMYENPSLVVADRATRIALVRSSIDTAVRGALPIQEILKAYLGSSVDSENTVNPVPEQPAVDAMDEEQQQQQMQPVDDFGEQEALFMQPQQQFVQPPQLQQQQFVQPAIQQQQFVQPQPQFVQPQPQFIQPQPQPVPQVGQVVRVGYAQSAAFPAAPVAQAAVLQPQQPQQVMEAAAPPAELFSDAEDGI